MSISSRWHPWCSPQTGQTSRAVDLVRLSIISVGNVGKVTRASIKWSINPIPMCSVNPTMWKFHPIPLRPINPNMRSGNLRTGINIQILSRRSKYIIFECRSTPSQKPPKFTGPNSQWLGTPTGVGIRLDGDDDFGGLIHNANPEDADFSVYTERPSGNNNNNFGGWTPPTQQGEHVKLSVGNIQAHQQRFFVPFTADRVPWGASAPRPVTRAPGRFLPLTALSSISHFVIASITNLPLLANHVHMRLLLLILSFLK